MKHRRLTLLAVVLLALPKLMDAEAFAANVGNHGPPSQRWRA